MQEDLANGSMTPTAAWLLLHHGSYTDRAERPAELQPHQQDGYYLHMEGGSLKALNDLGLSYLSVCLHSLQEQAWVDRLRLAGTHASNLYI